MTNFRDKERDIALRIGDEMPNSDSIVGEESGNKQDCLKSQGSMIGKNVLNPWESSPRLWSKIFIVSCVIGVLIDPLFLYIPIINEGKKCLRRDETMKNLALVLRSITDFAYIWHIFVRLQSALKMAKKLDLSILTGLPWSYLLIDILAILPIPQVVVLVFFSKMAGSKSLTSRKFLNILLLLQYFPRILRIYLSAKELGRAFDSLTRRIWVRGAFNFFLYIIAGHVFGAFWYFYSIFRETACWHSACKRQKSGCNSDNSFDCHGNSISTKNLTYFNEACPCNPTNEKVYDFGIFAKAIESGILGTTNFPKKFSKCFWWGLRNLSSFGQNLDTSSNVWENLFAVLISMLGLLLFLYLIGNLQTYIQLATTKSEEARQKISAKEPEIKSYLSNHGLPKHKEKFIIRHLRQTIKEGKDFDVKHLLSLLEDEGHKDHDQQNSESFAEWVTRIEDAKKLEKSTTERSAELWISKNNIPSNMKREIMRYVRLRLLEGNVVDSRNILPVLPLSLGISVKKHLCLETLKKVPMLQKRDEKVYETICNYLKPVIYSENSYIIRKGEPIDLMFFITQGVVWTFGKTNPLVRLEKGDYYGNELIEWQLKSTSYLAFPISTRNVKCHTKVEALALTAIDLEHVLSNCWSKFPCKTESVLEGLAPFALSSLQELRRRNKKEGKRKSAANDTYLLM
ncbi:hypothetical protein UlMin_037423 [Ulmus minor]